jgi:tetratricopeptide (TPR) repeat protein
VAETPPEPDIPERRIPDDSVYPLLLAEFAMRRGAYDVALQEYMVQSPILRDPGVSAHTTHISQFLQREEEALEASRLWVELEPDNMEANNTYASLLVRRGQTVEALPYLALVERSSGSANFPVLLNGFNQLDDRQRAALVRGVNELAAEFPDNPRLLLTQAMIHSELGQYDAALDKLDAVLKLEPEQNQALLLEARLLVETGSKKPYARLERALAKYPEDTLLRLRYARLLTGTDMKAAREQFEILSAQSPHDPDLLFSLALINREIGDNLAASAYLRQVVALGERADEANYYLGRIAEDRGELEEAVSYYMQVGDSREFLPAASRVGTILVDSGQLERNAGWFENQREAFPQRREALYGLEADLLGQAGDSDAALQLLDRALADEPKSTPLRYARAMQLEQRGELDTMEQELRRILREDPDNATALNALGYTLANRTGRYTEALQLISRALELEPNEPAILDSMGWVLYRTGQHQEALDYLTRAYASFPDPEVAAHLGEVMWVTGDTEGARAVWQAAALRDPDHPVLRETLERLNVGPLEGASTADQP